MKSTILLFSLVTVLNVSCAQDNTNSQDSADKTIETMKNETFPFQLTDDEWKKKLTPEQYRVLREKGTERPFTGKYNLHAEEGAYLCAACGAELFSSEMKFDSNCGWPSFDTEIAGRKIIKTEDRSHGMLRIEILCANCGSHLGHLFDDGPTETGLRYCVNSESLNFRQDDSK